MSFVQLLSIGVALAICALPVLLRRRPGRRGREVEPPVPPAIIRNAWIAYALRASAFVAIFGLGTAGEPWPAIAAAIGFGAGLCLLGALRRPVAAFLDEAHRQGQPATLHAFVAQACGGTAGFRATAASVSVVALLGLVCAEVATLVIVVTPLTGEGAGSWWFATLLAACSLYALLVGEDGARYASQALLGAVYIGLFGSAAFLLYLSASDLRPMPPHGALALMALATCCIAILIYRETKYIETPRLLAPEEGSRWRRAVVTPVRVLQRFANVGISVFAVTALVIAGMEFYFLGLPDIVRDGFAGLGTAPGIPVVGCLGIAMLALTYPLVDAVNWQSAGAFADCARADDVPVAAPASFQRPLRMIAGETTLIGILAFSLGAVAALAADLPADNAGMPDLVRQLALFDNGISDAGLTLLLLGLSAMAASTIVMAISTAVRMIDLDILPALRPSTGDADGAGSSGLVAEATVFVGALVGAALWIASGVPSAGLVDARFYALALAFACLQLSLLPLLLARFYGTVLPGAGAALIVLAGGGGAALGSIATYRATAEPFWLWLAVPACLVTGLVLLAATARRPAASPVSR